MSLLSTRKTAIALFIAALAGTSPLRGQTLAECEVLFKRSVERTRSLRLMSRSNAFEMTAHVTLTPEKGRVAQERMEIVSLNDKYKYVTSQMTLFQDKKTMVVVQDDQRSVFVTNPVKAEQRQVQFAEMIKLQDSLQHYLTTRECTREFGTIVANAGYTKVVLVPNKKLAKMGLKSVLYWIDAASADVKKITLEFLPGSSYGLKRYEFVIERMNTQSTTVPFAGEAIAQVMKAGKLTAKFKDYQLIDKRN